MVDEDASPPPELRLAWACEKWKSLPEAGAYLDQDHQTMFRMTVFSNVYNTLSRFRSMHGAQIHALSDGERKILRWLKDTGILFKA